MTKKQKNIPTLKTSERITLAVCVGVISLSFLFIQTIYFTFSWIFFLIIVLDLIVLIHGRPAETAKRLLLLFSIVSALLATWFAVSVYFPWLFH